MRLLYRAPATQRALLSPLRQGGGGQGRRLHARRAPPDPSLQPSPRLTPTGTSRPMSSPSCRCRPCASCRARCSAATIASNPPWARGDGYGLSRQDRVLGRTVAIKCLHSNLAGEPDICRRFIREARILRTFSHTNVVTVHDLIQEQYLVGMVMEYIEGPTLLQELRRWRDHMPLEVIGPLPVGYPRGHGGGAPAAHRAPRPQARQHPPPPGGPAPRAQDRGLRHRQDPRRHGVHGERGAARHLPLHLARASAAAGPHRSPRGHLRDRGDALRAVHGADAVQLGQSLLAHDGPRDGATAAAVPFPAGAAARARGTHPLGAGQEPCRSAAELRGVPRASGGGAASGAGGGAAGAGGGRGARRAARPDHVRMWRGDDPRARGQVPPRSAAARGVCWTRSTWTGCR